MFAPSSSRISHIWLGLLALFSVVALAQEGGSGADRAGPFESMRPLVGHTFVAIFPNGKMTDTQHFEWVYGGKFIRNVHHVRNEKGEVVYEGETIFAYDQKQKRLTYYYFNATGGYLTGYAVTENGRQIWYGENHADAAQTDETKSAIWDVSAAGYKATQYFRKEGEWQEQWTMSFERKE